MDSVFAVLAGLALGAWLIVAAVSCFFVYHSQRDRAPLGRTLRERIALIVPVRGIPADLDALWNGIRAQSEPPSRVIFAVERTADPAYAALQNLPGTIPVEVIVAGPAGLRGQKVHNQLAALRALRPDDAVVVFADADIIPKPDWLARLTRDLEPDQVVLASGYRWMQPMDDRWATAFVCVINSSIATIPRRNFWTLAWGGSMAIRRPALDALRLQERLQHAVLDDLPLSNLVRERGGKVRCPRDVLVPTPASYSWRDAVAFGRRQYLFVRWHAPGHWALAAVSTTAPLIGWAFAIPLALGGSKIAIAVIIAANALDQVRASLRRRVPRKLWGEEIAPRVAWLDRWATPAWLAVHAGVIWSTLFGRSMRWAGHTYSVDKRQRVWRHVAPSANSD